MVLTKVNMGVTLNNKILVLLVIGKKWVFPKKEEKTGQIFIMKSLDLKNQKHFKDLKHAFKLGYQV